MKVLDYGFVKLIKHMGDDDFICEAARLTTNSQGKDNERLIRYLMRNKHMSPFEFVEFVFHIKLPIFIARQLVRHRTASINERSGRYTVLEADCYKGIGKTQFEVYWEELSNEVPRETARLHLPLSTYTEMYWKMDLNNLLHFLELRLDKKAQSEMQEYAKAILELITPIVPKSIQAFMDYRINSVTLTQEQYAMYKSMQNLLGDTK